LGGQLAARQITPRAVGSGLRLSYLIAICPGQQSSPDYIGLRFPGSTGVVRNDVPACPFLNLAKGWLESLPQVAKWLHMKELSGRLQQGIVVFGVLLDPRQPKFFPLFVLEFTHFVQTSPLFKQISLPGQARWHASLLDREVLDSEHHLCELHILWADFLASVT
jgi:hypothetical protein